MPRLCTETPGSTQAEALPEVAEPLRDWLREPWHEHRRYDYRVIRGTTLAGLEVERL